MRWASPRDARAESWAWNVLGFSFSKIAFRVDIAPAGDRSHPSLDLEYMNSMFYQFCWNMLGFKLSKLKQKQKYAV